MPKQPPASDDRWRWSDHSLLFYVVVVGILYGAGYAAWVNLTEDGLWLSILTVAGVLAVVAFLIYFLVRVGIVAVETFKREYRR